MRHTARYRTSQEAAEPAEAGVVHDTPSPRVPSSLATSSATPMLPKKTAVVLEPLLHGRDKTKAKKLHDDEESMKKHKHDDNEKDDTGLRVFGYVLTQDPWLVFGGLCTILLAGFIAIGLVEEAFKVAFPTFVSGWSMTAIELLLFSAFAALERVLCARQDPNSSAASHSPFERRIDWKWHLVVAAAMTSSRGLTNVALLRLNYPTQVVFKSAKLVTVMAGSKLWLNKEYSTYKYLAVPALVFSAMLFTIGDAADALTFDFWGIVAVVASLVFDSIHANAQEYTLRQHRDAKPELLIYSNCLAGILAAVIGACVGEFPAVAHFLEEQSPLEVFLWFLVRVVCLYVGVSALMALTKRFGAVTVATITTVRKILTVLLSYMIWPDKAFGTHHKFGSVLFVLALLLDYAGVRSPTAR